ncbi:hypothetical protein [Enterococcus asini]|uniref:hypothetical protein n=1 Tax=Enterococcus asini TaxID=57732 RepID=UPI00266BE58C|nr:hypothetical protein [Enterococcus asini]
MSSELIKINTSTYSRKLDEILENRTEVYLKAKLTKRLTYGEYVGEPKNGFELVLGDTVKILDLDNVEVFEQPISPSLTDDQQVVLEWLKENGNPNEPFAALDELTGEVFYTEGFKTCIYVAFNNLTGKQQFQVLAAFAEWGVSGD